MGIRIASTETTSKVGPALLGPGLLRQGPAGVKALQIGPIKSVNDQDPQAPNPSTSAVSWGRVTL